MNRIKDEKWPVYFQLLGIVQPLNSPADERSAMSEFPLWLRLTHFFNFLFITLLLRSGIEILGTHPKLYWNDDAFPGSEWFRLGEKRTPEDDDRMTATERVQATADERALSDGAGAAFEQPPESAADADENDGSPWTAEDEIVPLPFWLALPGKDNLGLGRHWHFWAATGWAITGGALRRVVVRVGSMAPDRPEGMGGARDVRPLQHPPRQRL